VTVRAWGRMGLVREGADLGDGDCPGGCKCSGGDIVPASQVQGLI